MEGEEKESLRIEREKGFVCYMFFLKKKIILIKRK